jgi:RES domain-containing protein
MGSVKSMMMEAEERGWNEPDGHVCAKCVEDPFLKQLIGKNLNSRQCDYCGRKTRKYSAAPVESLMEVIAETFFHYFNEPTQAGVPYEGGFLIESTDTKDAMESLPFACHDRLFEDIADAFINDSWVRTADGHWASSHPHEILSDSWNSFVSAVKHEVRFFFQHSNTSSAAGPQEFAPRHVLPAIGGVAKQLKLIRNLDKGTNLYRVRERYGQTAWPLDAAHMGPPPSDAARAGRMNPAGISYLYVAFEEQTAFAETMSSPPCLAGVACFETARILRVLDLTDLPAMPSIFDSARRSEREGIIFLRRFVAEISRPVRKDGQEHIDYVPSQVVSEYFALVFKAGRNKLLDGVIYPSAVRPGGRNLVLFPTERGFGRKFNQVVFKQAWERKTNNWAEFSQALS